MNIEIERKFLIELPERSVLLAQDGCRVRQITQSYLTGVGNSERRVRKIVEGSETTYVFTSKEHISKISRYENEYGISREEYLTLLGEEISRLTKTRYAFPHCGHVIEIDVYPYDIGGDALDGKAVLEVELGSEDEKFALPDFIRVIRELTGTREFSNKTLAKKVK